MEHDGTLRIFDGAVAIITGGASGIGRALSEALGRRGASVVLADRQVTLAQEVAGGIQERGGQASAVELDVTDFAAVDQFVQATVQAQGRLDYMFNNAGIAIGGEVRLCQIEDWDSVLNVNLHGVVNGVQAAYPIMLSQGYGHIVNTASMAGLLPMPAAVSYATTKHAVVGLSKSLRVEAALYGIRVSVLCPGFIRTPILHGGKYGKNLQPMSPEVQEKFIRQYRPMDPAVFAEKVLDALARNKALIIVPSWWRLFWWLSRLSPALEFSLAQRGYRSARKAMQSETDA
ncbi:MAG: SDR family NAD(P)-dependent oxidoreductase [Desulfurellaceae bacterium]|nr:SDR family NAD(P)-dependent oxidoreductase [Desulfurellaceae bacterium]